MPTLRYFAGPRHFERSARRVQEGATCNKYLNELGGELQVPTASSASTKLRTLSGTCCGYLRSESVAASAVASRGGGVIGGGGSRIGCGASDDAQSKNSTMRSYRFVSELLALC